MRFENRSSSVAISSEAPNSRSHAFKVGPDHVCIAHNFSIARRQSPDDDLRTGSARENRPCHARENESVMTIPFGTACGQNQEVRHIRFAAGHSAPFGRLAGIRVIVPTFCGLVDG